MLRQLRAFLVLKYWDLKDLELKLDWDNNWITDGVGSKLDSVFGSETTGPEGSGTNSK